VVPQQNILWYPSKIFCGTPAKYFVVPQQNVLWYPSKIFCGTSAKYFVVPQQNILWYPSKIFCGTPAKYFVVPQENIFMTPALHFRRILVRFLATLRFFSSPKNSYRFLGPTQPFIERGTGGCLKEVKRPGPEGDHTTYYRS